jgi:hypothetical protein
VKFFERPYGYLSTTIVLFIFFKLNGFFSFIFVGTLLDGRLNTIWHTSCYRPPLAHFLTAAQIRFIFVGTILGRAQIRFITIWHTSCYRPPLARFLKIKLVCFLAGRYSVPRADPLGILLVITPYTSLYEQFFPSRAVCSYAIESI